MKPNYDVVKRWVNEAQEAVSSDNTMVQVLRIQKVQLYHLRQALNKSIVSRQELACDCQVQHAQNLVRF